MSSVLKQQLNSIRKTRSGKNKASGVFKLPPDTNKRMVAIKRNKNDIVPGRGETEADSGKLPNNEFDLKPYHSYWEAGQDHYDYGNNVKHQNRFLLFGRPQIGKTGVFLYLAKLIWEYLGKPAKTSPRFADVHPIQVEIDYEPSDEEEEEIIDDALRMKYPIFEHLQQQPLPKPSISKTYGDPNDKDVLDYYRSGNRSLHPSVAHSSNRIILRTQNNQESRSPLVEERSVRNKFCSKTLKEGGAFDPEQYYVFQIPNMPNSLGELHVHKTEFYKHFTFIGGVPRINNCLEYPPIIIPSSGRWNTALLDLSEAMENDTNYVQVVVIYNNEAEEYKRFFASYPKICFFVMSIKLQIPSVGCSRFVSKKVAEQLVEGSNKDFAFFLDDNILCWDGIVLKNDPAPMFDVEVLGDRSQKTHTSLLQVMKFASNPETCSLGKFTIVGFLTGTRQNQQKLKSAFLRRHVHVAVLLNLRHLKGTDYNSMMIAMEDIEFNMRASELVHPGHGVFVKCLRYVPVKKHIGGGGVVADNQEIIVRPRPKEDYSRKQFIPAIETTVKTKVSCETCGKEIEENLLREHMLNHKDEIDNWLRNDEMNKERDNQPSTSNFIVEKPADTVENKSNENKNIEAASQLGKVHLLSLIPNCRMLQLPSP